MSSHCIRQHCPRTLPIIKENSVRCSRVREPFDWPWGWPWASHSANGIYLTGLWWEFSVCTYVHAFSLVPSNELAAPPGSWHTGSPNVSLTPMPLLRVPSSLRAALPPSLTWSRLTSLLSTCLCSKFPLPSCQWESCLRSNLRKQDPVLFPRVAVRCGVCWLCLCSCILALLGVTTIF